MKDLKRFITNKNIKKYKRGVKFPIDYASPTDVEFLAYCVFNSFKEQENQAMNFSRYMESEEYLNLSLQCYGGNNFEDYDIRSDYTRKLILDALLPKYEIDDLEVYFDSYWADREEDYFQENIDLINDFAKKHKIKKKLYSDMIEDKAACDDTRIFALVIKSNYLKSIYKNSTLNNLFEWAIPNGFFLSPTKFVIIEQIYNDGFGDEPQVDNVACIKFIEEYKKIYKRKREYQFNYLYANQLVEINALSLAYNNQSLISYLLDGVFETRTEVMF